MKIEMELWHLILLLLAFFGCVGGFGSLLLAQIDKRLDERFAAQEEVRKGAQKVWQKAFDDHMAAERRETEVLHQLEKDFLGFKGDLPLHYVRREDYIRGQTVLEAKMDALYSRLEVVILKGARND